MNEKPLKEEVVQFHPEQLKYLERVFPPCVFGPETSEAAMRFYNGQRSIIEFIRSRQRSR